MRLRPGTADPRAALPLLTLGAGGRSWAPVPPPEPDAVLPVPLDSVRRLEARRVSGARTGALAAGVLLGLAAALYLVAYEVGFWAA